LALLLLPPPPPSSSQNLENKEVLGISASKILILEVLEAKS
jgi:hypothetical protein